MARKTFRRTICILREAGATHVRQIDKHFIAGEYYCAGCEIACLIANQNTILVVVGRPLLSLWQMMRSKRARCFFWDDTHRSFVLNAVAI